MKNNLWFVFIAILVSSISAFQNFQNTVIHARWDKNTSSVKGDMTVVYSNHSPDTLSELYFLLLYNIENPGMQQMDSVFTSQGIQKLQMSGPIVRIILTTPLLPGDSVQMKCKFTSTIPPMGDRWGVLGEQVILGAWYPQIAVYDRRGWNILTSKEGEYYQEFGNFKVWFELPDSVVLTGTGHIQPVRRDTVAHTTTYEITANGVQDVLLAWDPTYQIIQLENDIVPVEIVYSDYLERSWMAVPEVAAYTLWWLKKHIGPFPYESLKIISGYVSAGGIEYPGAVVINANVIENAELKRTVIHEMIHQYFYGALGNNQTLFGWMDEGFATFLEGEIAQELKLHSMYEFNWPPAYWYSSMPLPDTIPYAPLWYQIQVHAAQLDAPSDWVMDWYSGDPYFYHYERLELILNQLKSYLGKERFYRVLQEYYRQNYKHHPYPDDFYRILDQVSGETLSNAIRGLISNPYNVDLEIQKVKIQPAKNGGYRTQISLRKNTVNGIPFLLQVKYRDSTAIYRVPVSLNPGYSDSSKILSPWFLHEKNYQCAIRSEEKPREISILRRTNLLDVNWANDHWKHRHPVIIFSRNEGYYIPGWIQGVISPDLFFDDWNKWMPGIRWKFRRFPSWNYNGHVSLSFRQRKIYHRHLLNFQLLRKPNSILSAGMDLERGFITNNWRIFENFIRYSPFSWFETEIEMGNRSVNQSNYYLPVDKTENINTLIFGVRYKKNANYRRDADFREIGLETVFSLGASTLPTVTISFLQNKTLNYAWLTDLGVQIVYQHPDQPLIHSINASGISNYEYVRNHFHRFSGILPVQWFQHGHQVLSSEIHYVEPFSRQKYSLGVWQTFRITYDNLNYFIRSKFFFHKMDFQLFLWNQNRLLSMNVDRIKPNLWKSTFGTTIQLKSFLSFRWIPEILIHLPAFTYERLEWKVNRDSWAIELRRSL
jgi:hypothetical protein